MSIKIKDLKLIPTYARDKGITKQAVYKQVKAKKHRTIVIDGITFIDTSKK